MVVYHAQKGCETGCCGHVVELIPDGAVAGDERFQYEHPHGETERAFAERLVRETFGDEHVADLDWENCQVYDD